MNVVFSIDYFAGFIPDLVIWDDDLNIRNKVHCYYVIGLGCLVLGEIKLAKEFLTKVTDLDINHIDSFLILKHINEKLN